MSLNQSKSFNLTVEVGDEAAEIFIIDSQFHRIGSGIGKSVVFPLEAGLYSVKVTTGFGSQEKTVALLNGDVTINFTSIEFSSPAPLEKTAKTHEFHISNAVAHSHHVHVQIGEGSQIYVFARIWTEKEQTSDFPILQKDPATGLTLRDLEDRVLVDFGRSDVGFYSPGWDPWSACNIQLNPGVYCLCLQTVKGKIFKQTIVASPLWQTQIFLLQRDYNLNQRVESDEFDMCADSSNSAIFMSKIGRGFQSDIGSSFNGGSNFRLTEIARQALIKNRRIFSNEHIYQMLDEKFSNPMLGIYGCHLLLMDPKCDYSILPSVVNKLRKLLKEPHPDVEAIALKLNIDTDFIFYAPPMLRQSWNFILKASVRKPELVPEDSLTSQIVGNLWSSEQWLLWGSSGSEMSSTQNFLEDQLKKILTPEDYYIENSISKAESLILNKDVLNPNPKNIDKDEKQMEYMVQALGVPWGKIDSIIKKFRY